MAISPNSSTTGAIPGLAPGAARVPYSRIRELAELAMQMEGVIPLYFGESNIPTPGFIKEAAKKALDQNWTYYAPNAGLPSLREKISHYYERLHQVQISADQVVVTASGVQALHTAIRCVVDPGDEVLILTPAWPNSSAIVQMFGGFPRHVPHVVGEDRYTVDCASLHQKVTSKTRLLIYTSPSNPLGWTARQEEQQALLDFCRSHGLWLLADEVYERIYYGSESGWPSPTILKQASREDAVIVVQSFSKAYCMTGWRLGWIVSRPDLAKKAAELNEFVVSHATTFVQKAGEAALEQGDTFVCELVQLLRRNRDLVVSALRGISGIKLLVPEGAFYVFFRIEGLADSFEFCRRLLLEEKIGLAPGVAFGAGGEGHVRLNFAVETGLLEKAIEALTRFLTRGA